MIKREGVERVRKKKDEKRNGGRKERKGREKGLLRTRKVKESKR